MAGRKPIVDNRKSKVASIYVSAEEIDNIDRYVKEHDCYSRAWFIRRVVFDYIDKKLVSLPGNMNYDDMVLFERIVQSEAGMKTLKAIDSGRLFALPENLDGDTAKILQSVLGNKKKLSYLMSIIKDSRILYEDK